MKTILLKFAGPMQAWGTNSHFENRYTDRYPSKSAVIGLIAASFGYGRDEDALIQQFNTLDFAVRIDQAGDILKDFHIATKYKGQGKVDRTYVSNRYYIQDAVFVVAIGSKDEDMMNNIEKALKYPYFQTFLGRRSLPLNVDFYLKTTYMGVIDSLNTIDWQASQWYQTKLKKHGKVELEIYSDSNLIESTKRFMVRDLVLSFSQKERRHGFRPVSRTKIDISHDHDAFGGIGA